MTRNERIHIFCQEIWQWYAVHKRILPWRDLQETDLDHKAYLIMVSEIMLQQTQVPRVIILYKKFIQKFPHIKALAEASNADALIAWRGLGYNNRALRLRDAAKLIVGPHPQPLPRGERGGHCFPRSMKELMKLPGVGHYTAAAVRNFAFGIPTACIDVNIRRILHRFFIGPENADGTWKKDDAYLLKLAEEVLEVACPHPPAPSPAGGRGGREARSSPPPSGEGLGVGEQTTANFHAALMDFGSLVCTKKNPQWDGMSKKLQSVCMSYGKVIHSKKVQKKEPGREIAGRFVPNRIIRGRIVEVLRDHPKGLSLDAIGRLVAIDWTLGDHTEWLSSILSSLTRDNILVLQKNLFHISTK